MLTNGLTSKRKSGVTWFRDFLKDKSGASVIIFALMLPLLVGFLGIGAEIAYWYVNQRNMQTAADLGAFTSAIELRGSKSESYAIAQGKSEVLDNGGNATWDTITINIPPTSGPVTTSDAAEVIVVRSLPRLFSALFIEGDMTIRARGVAQWEEGGYACILALDREAKNAVDISGTADIVLDGCDIQSNSSNPAGARVAGAAKLTTGCLSSAGGISYSSGLELTECSEPEENAALTLDPYADLPMPDLSGPCLTIPLPDASGLQSFTPGKYCNNLRLEGPTWFEPGTYILDGANLGINDVAFVEGYDVTFILTGGGRVTMNGSAEIHLTAPKTGTYKGILFFQDPNEPDATNHINGNSTSTFEGVFYFPSQELQFNGTSAVGPGCVLLIANEIGISGTSSFGDSCNEVDHEFYGMLKSAGYVRLVD